MQNNEGRGLEALERIGTANLEVGEPLITANLEVGEPLITANLEVGKPMNWCVKLQLDTANFRSLQPLP